MKLKRKTRESDKESLLSAADDPTAMIKTAPEVMGAPSRRVQIFNSSDNFAPDAKKQLTVHAKSDKSKEFLLNSLTIHYLFESLGPEDLERIVECMKPLTVKSGEQIIKQGDRGDLFYCLEVGSAIASVEGKGNVYSYIPGGCFGELALIYNSPRAATVTATANCEFWVLDLR